MIAARWVVVVRREHAALSSSLRGSFDRRFVEVILDRRQGERRRSVAVTGTERRHTDRRRPPRSRFRLAHEADGFQVFECDGRVLVQCGECAEALEYEMPHFREPPARLNVEVLHVRKAVVGTLRPQLGAEAYVQHSAEIQAFTAAGRPLLSCRLPARPPGLLGDDAADELEILPTGSQPAGLPRWIPSA